MDASKENDVIPHSCDYVHELDDNMEKVVESIKNSTLIEETKVHINGLIDNAIVSAFTFKNINKKLRNALILSDMDIDELVEFIKSASIDTDNDIEIANELIQKHTKK